MTYQVVNHGSHYPYGQILQEYDTKPEADEKVLELGDRSILAKVVVKQ